MSALIPNHYLLAHDPAIAALPDAAALTAASTSTFSGKRSRQTPKV